MKLPKRARIITIATVVLALPVALYLVDRSASSDSVARNVVVGTVPLGGLNMADATLALEAHENALLTTAGQFSVHELDFKVSPGAIALDVDVRTGVTDAMAARRDSNPIANLVSWFQSFSSTEVIPLPVSFDDDAIDAELDAWEAIAIPDPAFAGSVAIVDGAVQIDYPRPGSGIDRVAGSLTIKESMSALRDAPTPIPVIAAQPGLTEGQIDEAAAEMRQMINEPLVLRSEDAAFRTTITQRQLASAVRARIEKRSDEITVEFDEERVLAILEPHRTEYEIQPVNARFDIDLDSGGYTVIPGRSGTLLDTEGLLHEMKTAALGDGVGAFPLLVGAAPGLSTEDALAFTTMERIGGFSTEYPAGEPRVTNIQQMADDIDNAVVLPGEVFSINDHVGQRTLDAGYVAAPAIINGEPYCCDHPANIGGGVSQFGTTLFNAVFFSCLEDVEHQPHSLYFTRYPAGREATLGVPGPDVKFRNNTDHPVVIRTWHSAASVSVRMYGDNGGLTCDSDTHDKTDIVPFEKEFVADTEGALAPGEKRRVHGGIDGFLQKVDRVVTHPDGSEDIDLQLAWRYRPLSEKWIVHPCDVSGEPRNCPFTLRSVVGMSWDDALATLADLGLKAAQAVESVDGASQDNIVLSQSPARGERVSPGTTITLTVGSYSGGSDG